MKHPFLLSFCAATQLSVCSEAVNQDGFENAILEPGWRIVKSDALEFGFDSNETNAIHHAFGPLPLLTETEEINRLALVFSFDSSHGVPPGVFTNRLDGTIRVSSWMERQINVDKHGFEQELKVDSVPNDDAWEFWWGDETAQDIEMSLAADGFHAKGSSAGGFYTSGRSATCPNFSYDLEFDFCKAEILWEKQSNEDGFLYGKLFVPIRFSPGFFHVMKHDGKAASHYFRLDRLCKDKGRIIGWKTCLPDFRVRTPMKNVKRVTVPSTWSARRIIVDCVHSSKNEFGENQVEIPVDDSLSVLVEGTPIGVQTNGFPRELTISFSQRDSESGQTREGAWQNSRIDLSLQPFSFDPTLSVFPFFARGTRTFLSTDKTGGSSFLPVEFEFRKGAIGQGETNAGVKGFELWIHVFPPFEFDESGDNWNTPKFSVPDKSFLIGRIEVSGS